MIKALKDTFNSVNEIQMEIKENGKQFKIEETDNDNFTENMDMSDSEGIKKRKSTEGKRQVKAKINIFGLIGKKENQNPTNNGQTLINVTEENMKISPSRKNNMISSQFQSDSESEDEGSLDAIRKMNQERMAALINSLRNPELEKQMGKRKAPFHSNSSTEQKAKKRRRVADSAVRFKTFIMKKEPRKSARLQNQVPRYTESDLENTYENTRNVYLKRPDYNIDDFYIEDIEKVVFRPTQQRARRSFQARDEKRHIIPVEDITQAMLNNICMRVKNKVYSQDGTTCHQCRQKTKDQKTICRNENCVGIQGFFCGVCIKNRYGEDCREALLNPNWNCPVCRGKCNCSICRNKQGKRPTGILTPLALQNGYDSVDHFLSELRGKGDTPEEDSKITRESDDDALLGFSYDGCRAYLVDGRVELLLCGLCAYNDCDNSENLLGFSENGDFAVMGGNIQDFF